MVGLLYTRQSDPYRITYIIATWAVSAASWTLIWAAGVEIVSLLLSFASAATTALILISAVRHWTLDSIILLIAGTVTMFFGTALVLRCRFSRYRAFYIPLAIFWVALAFSLGGFAIEAHRWDTLSSWLTYSLGIVTFAWMGWTARHQRRIIPKEAPDGLQDQSPWFDSRQGISERDRRPEATLRAARPL